MHVAGQTRRRCTLIFTLQPFKSYGRLPLRRNCVAGCAFGRDRIKRFPWFSLAILLMALRLMASGSCMGGCRR